jgi:hypothetical protein
MQLFDEKLRSDQLSFSCNFSSIRAGDTHKKSCGVSFSSQLFPPIREGLTAKKTREAKKEKENLTDYDLPPPLNSVAST